MKSRRRSPVIAGLALATLVAAGLSATALSASAATSSTSTRVTISGVVPEGARDHVTVAAAEVMAGKYAARPGTKHPVDPTTGAFSFTIAKSAKTFTLFFDEPDTAPWFDNYLGGVFGENGEQSDDFVAFHASSSHNLGTVAAAPAGVIEGTLRNPEGDPIPAAQLEVDPTSPRDDDPGYFGFTDATGRYSVKVERDRAYTVVTFVRDYELTYYPDAATEEDATSVAPDAAHDYLLTGIDITAEHARASILGSLAKPSATARYQMFVYALDGDAHPLSSIPAAVSDRAENSFYFYDLASVSYGIAFRDTVTGAWMPWKSYTGSANAPAAKSTSANRCLLPFTGVRGPITKLGRITLGTTPCSAPFSGSAAFSGTVRNPNPGSKIVASLYYLIPDSDQTPDDGFDNRQLILVNSATVAPDGHYSIDGISTAGTYVAQFSASTKSPFFDTWQGGFLLNLDDSRTKAIDAAPTIAADTASSGNDVTLYGASYLRGTVTTKGKAAGGAHILAHIFPGGIDDGGVAYEGQGYSAYASAIANSHGAYKLKIPQNIDYTIRAWKGRYYGLYGTPPSGTVVSATAPGTVPGTFSITLKKS